MNLVSAKGTLRLPLQGRRLRLPRSKADIPFDLHYPATIINHLTYKDSLENERFIHSESLLLYDYFVILSFVQDLLYKHNEVLLIDV